MSPAYERSSYYMALTKEDLQAISEIMDVKLEPVNIRLDRLESEVSGLRIGQMEIRNGLKAVEEKVSETYQLALDAWGNSIENRTWLEKSKLEV